MTYTETAMFELFTHYLAVHMTTVNVQSLIAADS